MAVRGFNHYQAFRKKNDALFIIILGFWGVGDPKSKLKETTAGVERLFRLWGFGVSFYKRRKARTDLNPSIWLTNLRFSANHKRIKKILANRGLIWVIILKRDSEFPTVAGSSIGRQVSASKASLARRGLRLPICTFIALFPDSLCAIGWSFAIASPISKFPSCEAVF